MLSREGGVIPQPLRPTAVILGSPKAASRKHIYSIKAASPQASSIKKRKSPQALRRTHGPVQGRKAASLRKPLGGRENLSNQTLDPLWEGWGATNPHKSPRFGYFLSALIILY